MVAMKSMRRTKAEREAEDNSGGMTGDGAARPAVHDDVEVRLEHHHLQKLGLNGPLPHGTEVTLHGAGEVGDSGTRESYADGEPQHHMTIRLSRAGIEHEVSDEDKQTGAGLRAELSKNMSASEARSATKDGGKVKVAAARG